jgi:hypothetical protein
MIDNFKLSTGVLVERLKDLEANGFMGMGERPQTANVLSRISKYTHAFNIFSC